MLRWFCILAVSLAFGAQTALADTVTLRPRVEAHGAMITMGDVFDGAGAAAPRPIAPAPPAGQIGSVSMAVLTAAASAAGLDFTPPAGVDAVQVVHPGGARATLAPPTGAPIGAASSVVPSYGGPVAGAAIRRGEAVTLSYQNGGISLTMRTQAMQDAAIGQSIRLLNPSSNRVVLGVVTGPGAASAAP